MTNIAAQRKELVSASMENIKSIINSRGVNRDSLDEVKNIVAAMTRKTDLFGDAEFPTPKPEEFAKIYLLSDEEGGEAIAFMPEDIHHINVVSETPTRHFHLYGKGFDHQTDRLEFNLAEGTTKSASGSFIPVDESRRVL